MSESNQLADVILSNSLSLVTSLLDAGTDMNSKITNDCLLLLDEVKDEDGSIPDHVKVAFDTANGYVYPLHLAVVNIYHSLKNSTQVETALDILKLLLSRGADTNVSSRGLQLCSIQGYYNHSFDTGKNKAVDLAVFFKNHPINYYEDHTHRYMEQAITKIQKAASKKKTAVEGTPIKTTPVMLEIAAAWKSMLFSDKFSDITFKCADGELVPAHRNILSASSPYFATALDGPWQEATSGIWTTTYSSSLIKAVLTLIYTGETPKEFSVVPLELLAVVSEYDIQPAIVLATKSCIASLKVDTVKPILQAAHLHQNQATHQEGLFPVCQGECSPCSHQAGLYCLEHGGCGTLVGPWPIHFPAREPRETEEEAPNELVRRIPVPTTVYQQDEPTKHNSELLGKMRVIVYF